MFKFNKTMAHTEEREKNRHKATLSNFQDKKKIIHSAHTKKE